MAQPRRSEALYNGRIIGIESIYTVSFDGKQINIPGKVEELRRLGREGSLFCPCGCGVNLIVVAGEKNMRTQHFRAKETDGAESECLVKTENPRAISSKILLKMWLDDITGNLCESRVTLNEASDSDRKFEFTVLNKVKKLGICYWYNSANITSEKIDAIQQHKEITSLYVTDHSNFHVAGQYPEYLIKIQKAQGYLVLLRYEDGSAEYDMSLYASWFEIKAAAKDHNGLWDEVFIASGPVSDFSFSSGGEFLYDGVPVSRLANEALIAFEEKEKAIAEKKRLERERQERLRLEEEERRKKARERELQLKKEEEEKAAQRRLKEKEEERIDAIRSEKRLESLLMRAIIETVEENKKPVLDEKEKRWLKCTCCGKIASEDVFYMYDEEQGPARGVCKACKGYDDAISPISSRPKKTTEDICPVCGGKLRVRNGRFSKFLGCSNFPRCRFTKSL